MAPKNETVYEVAELKSKLVQLEEILQELRNTIQLAERYELQSIRSTHGDQFRRAINYLLNFTTASKRGVVQSIGSPPKDGGAQ